MVADNYDDEHIRGIFVNLVAQLVVEQPLKTPFVAAVVLVANSLKPEVVDAVLAPVAQATETSIAKGEWREVKLYLKFLACLQSSLEGDGLFPLLEELFSRAADLQTASSEDVRFRSNRAVPGARRLTLNRPLAPRLSRSSS